MIKTVDRQTDRRLRYVKCLGGLKGRNFLEELGMDGKIILKLILKICGDKLCAGFIWLRIWDSY